MWVCFSPSRVGENVCMPNKLHIFSFLDEDCSFFRHLVNTFTAFVMSFSVEALYKSVSK